MPSKHLKTIIKICLYICFIIALFYVTPKLIKFFIPLVLGWIISLIANPIVKILEKNLKVVRKHSSWLVIVGVIMLVVLCCYGIGHWAFSEVLSFSKSLPNTFEGFKNGLLSIAQNIPALNRSILNLVTNLESSIGNLIGKLGSPMLGIAGNVARNIPHLLVMTIFMFLSAYFFITDKEKINGNMKKFFPNAFYTKWNWLKDMFSRAVGGYFIAQFKIMGVIAVILWIGLIFLNVNYALLWAVIIAMLDFLPFFGTGFVIWPWSVYELLTGNYQMVVGLLCIYLVCLLVHQLLQPKFVGNTVGMDSFTTLICMYVGYRVSSVFGMILAVPIGIIIINLYKEGAFNNLILDIKSMMVDFSTYLKG